MMFAGTQRTKEQKELNTCKRKGQDTTKITSASADSRIEFSWKMVSFLVRTLCLCLVLMTIFLSVSPFSPRLVTMSSSAPSGVRRVNSWTQNAKQRRENLYCEALAFLRHDINLQFDEENMKPERLTRAPGYAGIDPSSLRISKWYQESTREDDDPHSSSPNRVDRMSNQVREPIENDEDRLAMKRGDMPLPLPPRVANRRIREDRALQEFHSKSDKMHCATPDGDFTQAWFEYGRCVFPQSVKKTGTNVELFNVPTYQ